MIGFLSLGMGIWIFGFPWGLLAFGIGIPFDLWFWFRRHRPDRQKGQEEIQFYLLAYPLLLKMVSAGGGLAANQLEYLEFILNYGNLRRLGVREIQGIRYELLSLSKKGRTFNEMLRTLSQGSFSQDKIQWLWEHASRIVNLKKGISSETQLYFEQFKEAFKIQEERQKGNSSVCLLDIYGILGCSIYSSNDEIKTSFRLLAKRYHPDSLPVDLDESQVVAATERFLSIFEAYGEIRKERNF